MTIGEHLEELRQRLVRSLAAITVGFILAFWRLDDVVGFMLVPLRRAGAAKLIQTKVTGAFMGGMKVAFFAGCILAAPVVVHQIWAFVAAGLYRHERRTVKYYVVPGFGLFVLGVLVAYFLVLPWALQFLIGFASGMGIESMLDFSYLLGMVAMTMFVFGLMFQLPLIMVFLMRLGVVEPATFRRYRRHFIVVSFAIAMVLTPPDVISQIALAGCMIALFEGAILVGARVARPRGGREEEA